MTHKRIYKGIAVIAALVCIGAVWKSYTPTASQVALARLRTDLQGVTPQFVDEHTTLSSDMLKKIEQDVMGILIAQDPADQAYYSQDGVVLAAVGERYVAFSVPRPTDNPSAIQILDSLSRASDPDSYPIIPGQFLFETDKVAVYVDAQNIYTYKPGQSSATPLPGAQLSGDETYDHCGGCMGGDQDLQATHTDTSFSITTYRWVQGKPEKVRELSFSL